jgi:hypothetical protein
MRVHCHPVAIFHTYTNPEKHQSSRMAANWNRVMPSSREIGRNEYQAEKGRRTRYKKSTKWIDDRDPIDLPGFLYISKPLRLPESTQQSFLGNS